MMSGKADEDAAAEVGAGAEAVDESDGRSATRSGSDGDQNSCASSARIAPTRARCARDSMASGRSVGKMAMRTPRPNLS